MLHAEQAAAELATAVLTALLLWQLLMHILTISKSSS
jgi:hypothetical protein